MEESNVWQISLALLMKILTNIFSRVAVKDYVQNAERKTNYLQRKMANFAKGSLVLHFEKGETKCPISDSSPDLENCNLCNNKPQKNFCLIILVCLKLL